MKNTPTPLTDEFLQSIQNMQEATTDDFFYTRLKARMERESSQGWNFPLKPAWIIGTLVVLLAVNGLMLSQRGGMNKKNSSPGTSLQSFAESYDQTISSTY